MTPFLLFLMFLIPCTAGAQTSYVAPTRLLRSDGYELFLRGDSFITSQNVNHLGERNRLAQNTFFHRYQSELGGMYGATDQLQFGLGARFRLNQARLIGNAGDEIAAMSSGLQSTYASMMYAFRPVDRLQYTLEGHYRFIPYVNETGPVTQPTQLILGDEGNEFSGGLGVTYASAGGNFLTARAGFRNPGNDLAHELYWQLEGALTWRYFSLMAGVDGNTSIKDDPFDGEPANRPVMSTGNSRLYNSTNREWIAPYAGFNVALGDHWRVELRGSQVVWGRSTDLGTAFSISLARRIEKTESKVVDARFKEYDLEATITRISSQKDVVIIDRGLTSDVRNGMRFDFYEFDYIGGNILIARGVVTQTKADSSVVKITQRYNVKKEVKEGLIGRASLK